MPFIKPDPSALNEILHCGDEFYISYNCGRKTNAFDALLTMLGQINPDNHNRPETALCIRDEAKRYGVSHYILYGDYREAYAAIAHQGAAVCLELFNKHIEHIADTSDVPEQTTQSN